MARPLHLLRAVLLVCWQCTGLFGLSSEFLHSPEICQVYNEEAAAVKEKYFATVAKYEASRPPAEHAKPSKGKVEKPKKKKSVPS